MINGWKIKQRLVRLQIVATTLTGEEHARELISVLTVQYSIDTQQLLAAMKDHASVNEVAAQTLKFVYLNLFSIGCFSHTIDRVGEHFVTLNLSEFIISWINLFSHSLKTRILWHDQTWKSMATYSATYLWSCWEVIEQVSVQFGDVLPFTYGGSWLSYNNCKVNHIFYRSMPRRRHYLKLSLPLL